MSIINTSYTHSSGEYPIVEPSLDDLTVYLDEGTLPPDGIDRKTYEKAQEVLGAIKGRRYFHIQGDDAFVQKVERAVETLLCRKLGRELVFDLVEKLENKVIEIKEGDECLIEKSLVDNVVKISISMTREDVYTMTRVGKNSVRAPLLSPFFISFGHELIHARHYLDGSWIRKFKAPTHHIDFGELEEQMTIMGVGEDSSDYSPVNENALRVAFGLRIRYDHLSAEGLGVEVIKLIDAKKPEQAQKLLVRIVNMQNERQRVEILMYVAETFIKRGQFEDAKQILQALGQIHKVPILIKAYDRIFIALSMAKNLNYLNELTIAVMQDARLNHEEKSQLCTKYSPFFSILKECFWLSVSHHIVKKLGS